MKERDAMEPPPEPPRVPLEAALPLEPCPVCGFPMPAIAGSKQAICRNCGYKEPCC
ncbi:MAG TPA: hypothetical protein VFB73_01355 [Chloroflexota bacterium]|nr:hypothetical protein [Chloroflexota bacterium]